MQTHSHTSRLLAVVTTKKSASSRAHAWRSTTATASYGPPSRTTIYAGSSSGGMAGPCCASTRSAFNTTRSGDFTARNCSGGSSARPKVKATSASRAGSRTTSRRTTSGGRWASDCLDDESAAHVGSGCITHGSTGAWRPCNLPSSSRGALKAPTLFDDPTPDGAEATRQHEHQPRSVGAPAKGER